MVEAFEEEAEAARAEGLIDDYLLLNGDGSAPHKNSQFAELILRSVDAIRATPPSRPRSTTSPGAPARPASPSSPSFTNSEVRSA